MKVTLIILSAIASSVCWAGKITIEGGKKVTKAGVISISADWVKDKGRKFDIALNLTNENKGGIIVSLDDLRCKRGNLEGTIKHTFFNTGEKTIDIMPTQTKHFNMVCDVRESTKGDFRVIVGRVFSNPNNDGKTKGEVLATNVEWVFLQTDVK